MPSTWCLRQARVLAVTCNNAASFALTDATFPYASNYRMKPPLVPPRATSATFTQALVSGRCGLISQPSCSASRQRENQSSKNAPSASRRNRHRHHAGTLVQTRKITVARMVELFTLGPARVLNLDAAAALAGTRRSHHPILAMAVATRSAALWSVATPSYFTERIEHSGFPTRRAPQSCLARRNPSSTIAFRRRDSSEAERPFGQRPFAVPRITVRQRLPGSQQRFAPV